MTRNPAGKRDFNGLRQDGQIPFGQPGVPLIGAGDRERYGDMAKECQIAALAYFEGLGLIQAKPPAEPQDQQ